MIDDTTHHKLIDAFFEAIQLRQIERSQQLLQALEAAVSTHPPLAQWCAYLRGILAFELYQDWAAAERSFADLLNEPTITLPRGRLLHALGRTLERQGRWQEAIAIYEQALAEANHPQEIERRTAIIERCKAWKHLAICCYEAFACGATSSAALTTAVTYCQQGIAAIESIADASAEIRWLEGSLWNTLGATYRYLGEWHLAADCYQRDLAICQALDDQHGIGVSYLNLGEIYHHRSEVDRPQALLYYRQALHLLRQYQDPYLEADALQNLGALSQAMGDSTEALRRYKQAVTVIEDLRTRISAIEARTGFFATVVATYGRLVTLLIANGEPAAAFDMVERARSRTFIEMLSGQQLRTPQAPATLLAQEAALRQELRTLYERPTVANAQIASCEQALDRTLQEIRLFAADYTDLRTVQPLTHRHVQERLPAGNALLSYFVAGEAIYAFVITPTDLTVHHLPIGAAALQRAFDREGNLVRLRPDEHGHLHEPWLLERLYQTLVQPLLAALGAAKRLYILPHGPLHFVPFQALYQRTAAGRAHFLLDEYELVYAPSATVLLDYCQQARELGNGSLLAIGYNGELRHAEAESHAIAEMIQGARLHIGSAATSATLMAEGATFRRIHIACHGYFNRQRPLMSYLLLADTRLYASDILQQLRLRADLVTLAACETGRNQVLQGDELLGLVRAFLYAGSASVLVTLWPVDELSTRILMECFYGQLLAGQPKAKALRHAQQTLRSLTRAEVIELLGAYGEVDPAKLVHHLASLTQPTGQRGVAEEPLFAHPYFWAPFILIGDQVATEHSQ